MKILKKILIVILILVALSFVIALFVKNEVTVEREVVINKPRAEVFEYVRHIKNQDSFSVWNMADPDKKKSFTGTDGTKGFVYTWEGNDQVGAGDQEITGITEGSRVDMALRFRRPMEDEGTAYMTTDDAGEGSTKVKWGTTFINSYPKNFMNLFMDSMLGGDMEKSLGNLKQNLETK
ncbi:polyketide cyclase [Flavobacterium album]|uniref:Polyketide cyclase n=1 Tax=Flavobacterium album TaxID=2175091 RepID=A0A2S1QX84_9FLAO|nr:SRPBCC family protein [Flavobacterium album]AWH85027.1 polyketide cyclase [Flavobacterium album]